MSFSVSYRIVSRWKSPLQCSPQPSAGLGCALGHWKEVNLLHTQALGGRVDSQIPKIRNRSVPVEVLGPGSHFLWCNIDQQGENVFLALLK